MGRRSSLPLAGGLVRGLAAEAEHGSTLPHELVQGSDPRLRGLVYQMGPGGWGEGGSLPGGSEAWWRGDVEAGLIHPTAASWDVAIGGIDSDASFWFDVDSQAIFRRWLAIIQNPTSTTPNLKLRPSSALGDTSLAVLRIEDQNQAEVARWAASGRITLPDAQGVYFSTNGSLTRAGASLLSIANQLCFEADTTAYLYKLAAGDIGLSGDFLVSGAVAIGGIPLLGVDLQAQANTDGYQFRFYGQGAARVPSLTLWRSRGTLALPTAVLSADRLGRFYWMGYDGTAWGEAALLQTVAEENWAVGAHGNSLRFYTIAIGAPAVGERLRLGPEGWLAMLSGQKFFLDGVAGTGHTYQFESSDDVFDVFTGGTRRLRLDATGQALVGSATFTGAYGSYSDDRCGLLLGETAGQSGMVSLQLSSTYNHASFPNYGLILVNGPNTGSYDTWAFLHDGPARAGGLHLAYGAQGSNMHTATPVLTLFKTGHIGIASGKRFQFDGVSTTIGDTYWYEQAANVLRAVVGGTDTLDLEPGLVQVQSRFQLGLDPTMSLDGEMSYLATMDRIAARMDGANRYIQHRVVKDTTAASVSAPTLTETTLKTYTVKANQLGSDGGLRLLLTGTTTGGGSLPMTLRVKFGGTTFHTHVFMSGAAGVEFLAQWYFFNAEATNAQRSSYNGVRNAGASETGEFSYFAGAIDTTVAKDITITGQLGEAVGQSITLRLVQIEAV